MEFKQELKTVLIPAVERMIEKEKTHIASLEETKAKFSKMHWFRKFFYLPTTNLVDALIEKNKTYLASYENSLRQYKRYAN